MFCPLRSHLPIHFSLHAMDPVLIQKLQAINRSKKQNPKLLLPRFIKLLLSVFFLCLFLSSPHWLPYAISILKKAEAIAFGPKGIFIVCNIIVVVLVGESKLSKSSMQPDIYQKLSYVKTCNDEADVAVEKREGELEEEDEEEEEVEELNKRVEEFIARVNKQRKLEAKLIDRCS